MKHYLFYLLLLVSCTEQAIQPKKAVNKLKTTGDAVFTFDGHDYTGIYKLELETSKSLVITDSINQIEITIKNINTTENQQFVNYTVAGIQDLCMTVIFYQANTWYYSTTQGSIQIKSGAYLFDTELLEYCSAGVDCSDNPVIHTISGQLNP